MNTIENNKLIAEFIGYKVDENTFGGIPVEGMNTITSEIDTLKFHKNWNWLMPVIEKIETVIVDEDSFNAIIQNNNCFIESVFGNNFPVSESDTKILATYEAVCQFIEWYNKSAE